MICVYLKRSICGRRPLTSVNKNKVKFNMVEYASYKYVLCSNAISLLRILDILNCENKYLSSISWIIFTLRSYVFIHKSTFKNPILVYIAYTNSQSIFLLVPIPIFHRLLVRVDIYVLHNHDCQQQLMYNL